MARLDSPFISVGFTSYLLFFKLLLSFYFELIKFLAASHQKLVNQQNYFEDRRVILPSSYKLIQFSDLHITLFQSGRQRNIYFYNVFRATRYKTTSLPAALNRARRIDTLFEIIFLCIV